MHDDHISAVDHNRLSRRQFLTAGIGAAALCALGASPLQAALRPLPERRLSLYNVNTGESLDLAYWADGRHIPDALARIDHLMRDHRTDQPHPIDPRLLDVISATHRRLGGKGAVHVISAYRSAHTNALRASEDDAVAQGSLHMSGKAVDIRVPGAGTRLIGKAAKSLHAGGVGTYAQSRFVHIDTGRIRYW